MALGTVDGRTWWPREIWGNYVAHMWELADEGKRPEATACLNHMVTDALELVPSCIAYLDQLSELMDQVIREVVPAD